VTARRRAATGTAARREAWRRGLRAETLAAWWLRLKGYRILARRFKSKVGEIDLVARRGRVLAVVEVKQRESPRHAVEALGPSQRRRIVRAAQSFIQSHPEAARLGLRLDVVLVAPRRWPRHIPGAWRIDDPSG